MKILTHPNPLLRQKSSAVEKIDNDIINVVEAMKKILLEAKGIGLAAPQLGKTIRLFIVQDQNQPEFFVFINPRINWKSREAVKAWEGCLSLPGLEGNIKRAKRIRVKALDLNGRKFSLEASDLLARAIQHENDHLDGILYLDYIKSKKDLRQVK